jgi:serine phosphatase RsbU (regulator of sigma subunit)
VDRLEQSFRRGRKRSAHRLLTGIVEDVKAFTGTSVFHDDLALISAEYRRRRRKR